ncbi:MAG: methyl viologen-reducing hydrogenase [Desulfobacteraceae bacterium]|nr:methyl viologen-reducing hydrogenase [Desulfobacteraceae bacterium]
MPLRLASESLSGCSGCEIALLNTGVGLLRLLKSIKIVHMPILMDNKYFQGNDAEAELEIPEAEIGLLSGAVRNEEQLRIAEKMRQRCGSIVAFGTCASYGGIPALANLFEDADLFRRYYRTAEATDAAGNPAEVVPPFLERTFALDEVIRVDVFLPGCPPHPDGIAHLLDTLASGKKPDPELQSVCDSCPTRREGKGSVQRIRRFIRNARFQPDKPPADMRCLLEQGFLCMGPVTLAGCSGRSGGMPRCIEARVPCKGCYGPVRPGGNQLFDILNALASNGIDTKNLPDRLAVLRYSGAHRRLVRTVNKPA